MGSSPAVSVVMAVRNESAHLSRTVASILAQDEPDLELILVENGSTDGTFAAATELASRDARIRVLRSDPPGLTRALIAGCAAARAEVIARHDGGDVSLPRRLSAQAALLRADPARVLVSCGVRFVGPEGEELYEAVETDGDAVRRSLLYDSAANLRSLNHHGSAMFLRGAYETAGGYRPEFRFAQDLDLWLRLAQQGSIAFTPEVLYVASITPQSVSSLHRGEQETLARLAVALRDVRSAAERDALLSAAARVESPVRSLRTHALAQGSYFIGRCLQKRHDPRARRYLLECVRQDPLHWRAWAALASSVVARHG